MSSLGNKQTDILSILANKMHEEVQIWNITKVILKYTYNRHKYKNNGHVNCLEGIKTLHKFFASLWLEVLLLACFFISLDGKKIIVRGSFLGTQKEIIFSLHICHLYVRIHESGHICMVA